MIDTIKFLIPMPDINLVEQLKGKIVGIAFLIELAGLKGKEKLKGYQVYSLIKY